MSLKRWWKRPMRVAQRALANSLDAVGCLSICPCLSRQAPLRQSGFVGGQLIKSPSREYKALALCKLPRGHIFLTLLLKWIHSTPETLAEHSDPRFYYLGRGSPATLQELTLGPASRLRVAIISRPATASQIRRASGSPRRRSPLRLERLRASPAVPGRRGRGRRSGAGRGRACR